MGLEMSLISSANLVATAHCLPFLATADQGGDIRPPFYFEIRTCGLRAGALCPTSDRTVRERNGRR